MTDIYDKVDIMKRIGSVEELLTRKAFDNLDKTLISDYHKEQMGKIIEVYDTQSIKNRLNNIFSFIKYDVDGDWLERINIIRTVLKNDVMSDYALEVRYGKDNMIKIRNELNAKVSHSLKLYIERFGESDGVRKWGEYKINSKSPWGLESCVFKYGEVDGPNKWDEMLTKKVNTMQTRKKIKPYRNGRTLPEYQDRYGMEVGYTRWRERNRKQSYRFSKQFYIDKFGEVLGQRKWVEYKLSMNKTSLSSFIDRYGKKVGRVKYSEYIDSLFKFGLLYSKISQELFWVLLETLPNKKDVKFYEYNGEEMFHINNGVLGCIYVDFKYGNKIIEYDGDYWHLKEEQITKDKLRDEYLRGKGYKILRVMDSTYRENKEEIINKCINFLRDEA